MLVEEIITETHSDHVSHLLSRDRGVRKRDVESDIDTIKTFGHKPDKRNVYQGKNPAGIPVYQRSITRLHDPDTDDHAVIRRSTRYAGPESEESREKETYDGPRHMIPKHLRRVKEDGEMCEPEKDKDGNEVCVVPMGDENLTAAEKKAADARDEEMWDYEDGLSDKQWNIYDNAMSKYIRSGVKNKTAYKAYLFARQQVEKTEVRGSTVAPPAVKERVLTTAQKLTQMQHYWDNLSHLAPDETKKKSLNTRFGIFNIKLDKNKIVSFDCCRHGYSEGKSPHKKGTKKYKNHMAAIHAGESIETISEVSPPGREKQVEKLKQKYGADSDVPFKIAWAQHNKHGVPKK